ncbi:MAG: type II toxin-antitoxin system RelB/DinJ family antitoxin [Defluviitaleaceae bacterium]|nr:type II toxin-antitoxin system RelB/DinJ family antitoxin [Defluviitaleaceae bacterium]
MEQIEFNIIVDSELKIKAEKIFNKLGISLDEAINLFFLKTIETQGFPFSVDKEDIEAIQTKVRNL